MNEDLSQPTQNDAPNALFEALKAIQTHEVRQIDTSSYRYVIYARKSTESEERQVRSLSDQIAEGKELAQRLNLNVVDYVTESESAKEPDIRPKFRKLLEDIKHGKYEGIIAWHPDRLARNMKDAGEIIDLLDKRIIKDLKFVSFTFENNTMGKMLLGMAFVLSKQYSDQLSDNVKRGQRRSIEDGKAIGKTKHGYYKDRNMYLRPDDKNFTIIKMAFLKRLQGESLDNITKFINTSNYERNGKPYKIDLKRLSEVLRDPFYTGIMMFGKNMTLLQDVYDFVPVITQEEFLKINKLKSLSRTALTRTIKDKGIKANLMRGIILCSDCGMPMTAGITPKKTKTGTTNYFYYRCDTKTCKQKGKSVRAKVIVDFVIEYLSEQSFSYEKAYGRYVAEMKKVQEQKDLELLTIRNGIKQKLLNQDKKIEQTKNLLLRSTEEKDLHIAETFKGDLKHDQDYRVELAETLKKAELAIKKNLNTILTYEDFIELFKKLANFIGKAKRIEDLDYIIKKIFLNFTIKGKEIASFSLNEPFDMLIDDDKFLKSRDVRNRTAAT